MPCHKCNSDNIIILESGRRVCQDCKAIQSKESSSQSSSKSPNPAFIVIILLVVRIIASGIGRNADSENYRQQQQEAEIARHNAIQQREMISNLTRSLDEDRQSTRDFLASLYGNGSSPTPLRRSNYGRCDCPYDILGSAQQRYIMRHRIKTYFGYVWWSADWFWIVAQ